MDLTWRDVVATAALVAMLLFYWAYLAAGSKWLLASPWSTAAALLVLGLGGLVISVRGHAHATSKELFVAAMRIAASVFGVIGLLAGVVALLVDSAYALKVLVMSAIITWLCTTVSHI